MFSSISNSQNIRFKAKYHPDEREKQRAAVKVALENRRKVFEALKEKKFFEGVSVDIECTDALTRILDGSKYGGIQH